MIKNQKVWDKIIASGKFQGGELESHEGRDVFRADIKDIEREGDLIYIESTWICVCSDPPAGEFKPMKLPSYRVYHNVDLKFELQQNGPSTRIMIPTFGGDLKILFPNDYTDLAGNPRSFTLANPELVQQAKDMNLQEQEQD